MLHLTIVFAGESKPVEATMEGCESMSLSPRATTNQSLIEVEDSVSRLVDGVTATFKSVTSSRTSMQMILRAMRTAFEWSTEVEGIIGQAESCFFPASE